MRVEAVHTTVHLLEPVKKLLEILAYDEDTTKKAIINKAIVAYAKTKKLNKEYLRPLVEEEIKKAEELLASEDPA